MTLKFSECTLSMHYRKFDDQGKASGGPMYYIERGLGPSFKWMGIFFAALAIVCSFGTGNMNQANTVAKIAEHDLGISHWITGVVLAILVGMVILGGIRRIGAVSSKLMPLMTALYTLGALFILFAHLDEIPGYLVTIVDSALSPQASFGGAALGAFHITLLWGVKRALFSNEAGQGSAPIAHAAAKTKEPVREGMVAMLGPFVDTLCICTLTGLVIISTGAWSDKQDTVIDLNTKEVKLYEMPSAEVLAEHGSPVTDKIFYEIKTKNESALKELEKTAEVVDGRCPGLLLFYNDGLVENARLITDEDTPFTGTIDQDGRPVGKEGEGQGDMLRIEGKVFQTGAVLTRWAFARGFDSVGADDSAGSVESVSDDGGAESGTSFGEIGGLLVTLSVFLFGLSTIISWSYYGDRCVEYLFGTRYLIPYRLVYVGFTCMGAILALEVVWAYGDLAMGLMTVPNLLAVIILTPVIVRLTKDYLARTREK